MSDQEMQSIVEISVERLLPEVDALRSAGWRIVQILCVSSAGGNELSYSFGSGLEMRSLRIRLPAEAPAAESKVPSITALYPAAFLYENEMHDLFGLTVDGMAVDFKGTFYKTAVKYPFGSTKAPAVKPATATATSVPATPAPVPPPPSTTATTH